jgi:hypothetical protein
METIILFVTWWPRWLRHGRCRHKIELVYEATPLLQSQEVLQTVIRSLEKKLPKIFQRITQKVGKSKKGQNIYNEAQFGSPKNLQQTPFQTLKYLQQNIL